MWVVTAYRMREKREWKPMHAMNYTGYEQIVPFIIRVDVLPDGDFDMRAEWIFFRDWQFL